MKRELNKKIRKLCESAGTAAAAEKYDELAQQMSEEYDARIRAGMSELDAYRAVLRDVDKIQELLNSLPETDEDRERNSRQLSYKWLSKNLTRISGCMWITSVIVYFLFSFTFGGWQLSWLIFLWTVIGQIVLSMVKKYNRVRGISLKKVMKGGLSGILWIGTTILYFLFSFVVGYWHLTWLIFPFASILQIMLNALLGD